MKSSIAKRIAKASRTPAVPIEDADLSRLAASVANVPTPKIAPPEPPAPEFRPDRWYDFFGLWR